MIMGFICPDFVLYTAGIFFVAYGYGCCIIFPPVLFSALNLDFVLKFVSPCARWPFG